MCGRRAEQAVNDLKPGQVLLENLRFYKEETKGDLSFAKRLSHLGDIYVNDALERHIELMLQQQLSLSFLKTKMFWRASCQEIESINKVLILVKTVLLF